MLLVLKKLVLQRKHLYTQLQILLNFLLNKVANKSQYFAKKIVQDMCIM
jgi:hypothetical protein